MDVPCTHCGRAFAKTTEHFVVRNRDGKQEWEYVCRDCRKLRSKKNKKKAASRREAGLKKIEDAGVDIFADSVIRGGANIPHSAEVLEMVMQYFGGVGGFSGLLVKQYFDSPPGGSARNRLIETIVRLVSKNVDQGGSKKPLSLWSETELEGELDARFQKALESYKGITINGEAKKEETPSLPAPLSAEHPGFDAVRTGSVEELARRAGGSPDRGVEAVPPDATAGGIPPVLGERSAGDRGEPER